MATLQYMQREQTNINNAVFQKKKTIKQVQTCIWIWVQTFILISTKPIFRRRQRTVIDWYNPQSWFIHFSKAGLVRKQHSHGEAGHTSSQNKTDSVKLHNTWNSFVFYCNGRCFQGIVLKWDVQVCINDLETFHNISLLGSDHLPDNVRCRETSNISSAYGFCWSKVCSFMCCRYN